MLSERKMKNLEGSELKPKRLDFLNSGSPSRAKGLLNSNQKSNVRFSIALRQSTCPIETEGAQDTDNDFAIAIKPCEIDEGEQPMHFNIYSEEDVDEEESS